MYSVMPILRNDTKNGHYAGWRHSEMLAFNSCDIVNLMKRGFEI